MLELVVDVRYEEQKARHLLDMDQYDTARNIRRDFDTLKLPHPPQANIKRPTSNGVTVSWKTQKNTVLYDIVTSIVADQDLKPSIQDAKFRCHIENLRLEVIHEFDSQTARTRKLSRSPSHSPSLHRRRNSFGRVERLDNVMQSLLKLNDSLRLDNLPETTVVSFQGAVDSLPAHTLPTSPQVCKSRSASASDTHRKTEMHLRNELARNGRELTAAVLRAAEIEKELEAFNTWTDPDTPQSDDVPAQLTRAVTEMILEQKLREDIEQILADVERECRHPTIVPALVQVMDEILAG